MTLAIVLCLSALGVQAGDPASDLSTLIDQLRSETIELRNEARRKLKEAGPRARPLLEQATRDPDPNVAAACKELLRVLEIAGKLSPALRAALPGVEERLAGGREPEWTRAFLDAVAVNRESWTYVHPELGRSDLEVLVAPALRGAEPGQLMEVCRHLLVRPFPSAVPELVKLLPKNDVGQLAASILSQLPFPETLAALVPLLKSESWETRYRVANILGPLHLPEAGPALEALLLDPNHIVMGAAIRALGELRYRPACGAIRNCLRIESERMWTVEALGRLGCKDAVDEIASSLDDRGALLRGYAAGALGDLGAKDAAPRIAKLLLRKPDSQERYGVAMAIGALGRLGAKDALPSIRQYLTDGSDVTVECYALTALGALDDRESAPLMVSSLTNRDIGVSRGARHALRRVKAHAQIPQIVALAKKNPTASATALSTLADLGARDAIGDILPFLEVGVPCERAGAAEVLCRLGSDRGATLLLEEHGIAPTMICLNALRSPELWARVEKVVLRQDLAGRPAEIVEAVARELGMTLEISPAYRRDGLPNQPLCYLTIPHYWSQPQPLDVLEWVAVLTGSDIILEEKQMKWVGHEEARAFWKEWLAARGAKPGK